MEINFKGLNNTTISSIKGGSSSGLIKMKAYRLVTNLSNDAKGEHFDNFYKALDKTGNDNAWKYVPKDFPGEQLIFDVSKVTFDNDMEPQVTFMLNGQHLPLDNDRILPVFSFLAKAITFIKNNSKNPETILNAQKMNDVIQEAVIDYIG